MSPNLSVSWLSLLSLFLGISVAEEIEKCYSCSSAEFPHRWPRHNNTPLYLHNTPIRSTENCDSMRSGLPVVPCPNSVCVKMVVNENSGNRAVCSALQGPIIVRDCWSRILKSSHPDLAMEPLPGQKVILEKDPDHSRAVGSVYTCKGFLCNDAPRAKYGLSAFITSAIFLIFR